jgi:two-component system, sensor histidine kinase RegB
MLQNKKIAIHDTLIISAARQNLRQLSIIRNIALGGQLLALLFFSQIQDIGLPVITLSVVLALYGIVIAATWWRSFQSPAITEPEFFSHLLIDILFFTALLYFSGGASNPFVSYYLVPISIAATTLPLRYTWSIALLSLGAYSWLLVNYLPIPALSPSRHHDSSNNLHILGMWCNFVVSALLITYFVTRMASTLKQQEIKLAQQREDQLRDEQVIGIGTLAAGTAHELGTPLNTMKILVDEMRGEIRDEVRDEKPGLDDDLSILQQQIEQCRTTLKQLVTTAETATDSLEVKPVREYFHKLLERWQVMRPKTQANIYYADNLPECKASFHPTIAQSLTNLLNNAADASPEQVDVALSWDTKTIELSIRDYGEGITQKQQETLGKPFHSEKPDGMGLGLFLTQASINRYGGEVTISPADGEGTLTRVVLPLAKKSVTDQES